MHRAVVGGATSVGKGRPGPISRERKRERRKADTGTSGEKRPNPNVGREEERDAHKNQHNTTLQKSEKRRLKGKEQQKEGFF